MRLTVLGAGPAYTDREGASGASYLVSEGETHVLLDLGQGSFPRLIEAIEPSTIDAVLISHLHPDHFIDLVPLRHYLAYQLDPPRRVRVVAPDGLADRIDALHMQGKRVLAAVGALHMTGNKGLPKLMAERGFSVERIGFAPI